LDIVIFRDSFRKIKKANELKKAGNQYFIEGKFDEALKLYAECLGIDPLNK